MNGLFPTTTTLAASGVPGNYTLDATVVGTGSTASLAGQVYFNDLGANGATLGNVAIGSSTPGLSLTVPPSSINLPYAYGLGDFNRDGVPDVVGVGQSNSVEILLGNGIGGFVTPGTSLPVGYQATIFAVGDFNGDGFQDIATASYTDAKLIILLGNGDGTFQSPAITPGVLATNTIVVGDFNGDGIADLATTNNGVSSVALYIGVGDGTFTRKSTRLAGPSVSLAIADLNGDGIQDLVAAEDSTFEALIGNGNGTFTSVSKTPVDSDPFQVITGDFNGDGIPDAATVSPLSNSVSIRLGQGNGSFTEAPTIEFAQDVEPYAIVLTDTNQDGIEDIAVGTASETEGPAYASVLFGTGQGTFNLTAIPIPGRTYANASEYSILSADMNRDGTPDLITGPAVLLDKITETAQAVLSGVSVSGSGTHSVQASSALLAPYNSSASGTIELDTQ